jgi:23S rRNA (uracil1939-C5)-methyltransferase
MTHDLITLELTGMAHGGSAIGRHEGRAIFVPYGIPGEHVRVRIVQDKGRFAIAEVVEVISASSDRVEPPCPYFGEGRCGGCQFQSIDYARQLALKEQIVRDQLGRLGGLPDVVVYPTIASPKPYGYRSHATFHVSSSGQLGFIKTDHRTVMPIDDCLLLSPPLRTPFEDAQSQHFSPGSRIRFQSGSEGQPIHFAMGAVTDDITEPLLDKPLQRRTPQRNRSNIEQSTPKTSDKPSEGAVYYKIKNLTFRCSAGSFFQVNLAQAEKLVDLVLERLSLHGDEQLLDLYSGVGLFTAFLAAHAAHVSAVELYTPAVEDAKVNLSDYAHVDFHVGKIESVLSNFKNNFDAAVVDPPRAGMDAPALDALINLEPRQIVYVSCDPATLARDAKRLTAAGYTLRDVQPVDMFPQTYHIECVAHFVR